MENKYGEFKSRESTSSSYEIIDVEEKELIYSHNKYLNHVK